MAMAASILIVDDEPGIRESLGACCATKATGRGGGERRGVPRAGDAAERRPGPARRLAAPAWTASRRWRGMHEHGDAQMVVMISGHGNIETAVRATKLGAFDFIEKPLSHRQDRARRAERPGSPALEAENRRLRAELEERTQIVGDSYRCGAAPADRDGGADQRPRADLRRERHGQGTGGARATRAQPAQREAVRGGQLRGDSRGADREASCSATARAPSPARSKTRRESLRRRTAARSSSTKSAT